MKETMTWYSERVRREMPLVRWGHVGTPVLIYPTAGGDAEEIERMLMIRVLEEHIAEGKIKVYSVDSIAAQAWSDPEIPAPHSTWLQNQFDAYIYHEVVPAIRQDCNTPEIEIVVAGASIGAFNAMASICRHPDVFRSAICMSGTYDVERFVKGQGALGDEFYFSSPQKFLPDLEDGPHLEQLRKRFILMCHGKNGRWEDPEQDWGMGTLLGSKGIPNRVDPWGDDYDHDWPTWRAMLPRYLADL